jgi:hypothetical protein
MNAARRLLLSMNVLNVPDGKTATDMKRSANRGGANDASHGEETEETDGSTRAKSEGRVEGQAPGQGQEQVPEQAPAQEESVGRTRWKTPDRRITALRRDAQESGAAYERNKAKWRSDDQGVWWASQAR